MDTITEHNDSAEALVAFALEALTTKREQRNAERREYAANVSTAARYATEAMFRAQGEPIHPRFGSVARLGWRVTAAEDSPARIAEAVVSLPSGSRPLLVFRAPSVDPNPEGMADNGTLYLRRECFTCNTDHVDRVHSLAELGELLDADSKNETDAPHDPPGVPDDGRWPLPITN
ncbi:hypothetical protein [Streptomyces parvulus]